MRFFKKRTDYNLPILIVVPLLGCSGKPLCVKCVAFKDIVGMSVNSAIHSKTLLLNELTRSEILISHKMTLLTIPYKIILTLLVSNIEPSISTSTSSTSKVKFGELNGELHPNSNKMKRISVNMRQLNTKFEILSTHQKMMETQLAHIADQVSHLS